MPRDCLDPADFVCTGNGADLLPNPALTWLLTTDGLIGTPPTEPEIPNGNINQLFWKLLQNDCAIANFVQSAFIRTYGTDNTAAPAVNTVPVPLAGAPAEPANGQLHTVIYNDFEVLYRYNETTVLWEETSRKEHFVQTVQTYEAAVTVELNENDAEATFPIPTETDDSETFAFGINDLCLIYIDNPVNATVIMGVIHGFVVNAGTVRVVFTIATPIDPGYALKAVFRRTVVS